MLLNYSRAATIGTRIAPPCYSTIRGLQLFGARLAPHGFLFVIFCGRQKFFTAVINWLLITLANIIIDFTPRSHLIISSKQNMTTTQLRKYLSS